MIPPSDLIIEIMRLSITTSALVIPSLSIAYFVMSRNKKEVNRMSEVIDKGSFSAIILLVNSIICFLILLFGWESVQYITLLVGALFLMGILLLLYTFLLLAGFKREIPHVDVDIGAPEEYTNKSNKI